MVKRVNLLTLFFLVALHLSATQLTAEVWSCKWNTSQSPVFTSNPSDSDSSSCGKLDLSKSSFTQFPAEHREGGSWSNEDSNDYPETKEISQYEEKHVSESIAQASPKSESANDVASSRQKPFTVDWNSTELSGPSKQRGSLKPELSCQIQGSASSLRPGVARITIQRGGATLDYVRLIVPGNFKARKWSSTLSGRCMEPQVTISEYH